MKTRRAFLHKVSYKAVQLTVLSLLILLFSSVCHADSDKIYIDITSPGYKKLPIAVQNFTGNKEISDVVKDDLTFTGLFDCIEDAVQIEKPDQPFNAGSWQGLGIELVVKGRVTPIAANRGLSVLVSAYDVSDGREVLKKEYSSSAELSRQLSHSIANDIYKVLTGEEGIFRTRIAFVANSYGKEGGMKELYLMDWDGHRMQGIGITAGILLTPRWSTDKTKLLYSAERQRQWGLYMLDMNIMRERTLGLLGGLNITGNFFNGNKEFVFSSSKDGSPDIYIADITSMKFRKVISSPWIDVSPSVSPDGSSILFVSNRSGTPQIYISDREGYGIRRLTFQGSYNTSPAWSPKGDRIAFASMIGGKNQIFVMKADGTGLVQLTDRGNNENPSFSPDGRYLSFTSDADGSKGIYLIRVNGEGLIRITPRRFRAINSSWSPF
ncbi:MAG: Tol-Pal system beta propeller repeat protein TolB [Nitrospirae bacterium]|nr:Tol-Pal system beta propeller repeat protein TolB [Nitrospirota bacterium]